MRGRAEQFSSPNYLLRMCLAGFGINIPQGINRALDKARVIVNEEPPDVPLDARRIVELLSQLALDIHGQIRVIERDLPCVATRQ